MYDVFNLNAGWCASICSVKGVGSIDTLEGLEVQVEVEVEVRPPPDAPPPVSTPPLLPAPAAAPIGARRGHHGTRARHWSGWLVARPSD